MAKRMWVVEIKMGGGWMAQDRLCVSREAAEEEKARFPHPYPYHARVREWKRVKEQAALPALACYHPLCKKAAIATRVNALGAKIPMCLIHGEEWDEYKLKAGLNAACIPPIPPPVVATSICAVRLGDDTICGKPGTHFVHTGGVRFLVCPKHKTEWDSH